MTYGGEETVRIIINADGTMEVALNDFAERDAQPELDEIVTLLNRDGMGATVRNSKVEYTGEYHKHTHTHGISDHTH